jgi:MFS family permease
MRNNSIVNINLRWFLAGMIFANIAGQMAYSMLSLYMLDLGASVAQVGMAFTLASLAPMVLQIFGGWLSDTIGRLRVIASGLNSRFGIPNPLRFPATDARFALNLIPASVSSADSQENESESRTMSPVKKEAQ